MPGPWKDSSFMLLIENRIHLGLKNKQTRKKTPLLAVSANWLIRISLLCCSSLSLLETYIFTSLTFCCSAWKIQRKATYLSLHVHPPKLCHWAVTSVIKVLGTQVTDLKTCCLKSLFDLICVILYVNSYFMHCLLYLQLNKLKRIETTTQYSFLKTFSCLSTGIISAILANSLLFKNKDV